MPARDIFHVVVKNALIKEGWTITHDPLHLRVGTLDMYIDLGAEKLIAAEKDQRKIAVEVKSFIRTSTISDFYLAIGQFIPYQAALEEKEPDRSLYLAVPQEIYESFFTQRFIDKIIKRQQVKLIIYEPSLEEIASWIN